MVELITLNNQVIKAGCSIEAGSRHFSLLQLKLLAQFLISLLLTRCFICPPIMTLLLIYGFTSLLACSCRNFYGS